MIFEENKIIEEYGEKAGFLLAYIIFTTILYFIFFFLNKLPTIRSYWYLITATLMITIIGLIIKRLLK